MNYIDNVYYINMDKSLDRRAKMESQENLIGKKLIRIPAVNGNELSEQDIKNSTTTFCNNFCTKTMIGIYLSHLKVYKQIIDNGDKYALIMEDDCEIIPTFQQDLQVILDDLIKIDPEWDFLYLGCFGGCTPNGDNEFFAQLQTTFLYKLKSKPLDNPHVFIPESPVGFASYIISQKCAQKMSSIMTKASYHVDVEFLRHASQNDGLFKIYATKKILGYQYTDSNSSTQTNNFPTIINNLLCEKDKFGISYSYYLNSPIIQIQGTPVDLYLIVFILAALVLPNKIFIIFMMVFFLIELMLDINNYKIILDWIIILGLICFIKNWTSMTDSKL